MKIKSILIILSLFIYTSVFSASYKGSNIFGIFTETYKGLYVGSSEQNGEPWGQRYSFENNFNNAFEGCVYLKCSGDGFYGTTFKTSQEFSEYYRIYFSIKFSEKDIDISKNSIKITDASDRAILFNDSKIKRVWDTNSTGIYTGDTAWHQYYIDFTSFEGLNTANIKVPFVVAFNTEKEFFVDNVFYLKKGCSEPGTAGFSVSIKNSSTNNVEDAISWTPTDTYQKGLVFANQYLELDTETIDWTRNSSILIYTDIDSEIRYGKLYNSQNNSNVDILWIFSRADFPNDFEGKSDYRLFYLKDKRNQISDGNNNYVKIWDRSQGLHTDPGHFWNGNGTSFAGGRIYIAGDFTNSVPLLYTAKIIIEYIDE